MRDKKRLETLLEIGNDAYKALQKLYDEDTSSLMKSLKVSQLTGEQVTEERDAMLKDLRVANLCKQCEHNAQCSKMQVQDLELGVADTHTLYKEIKKRTGKCEHWTWRGIEKEKE